MAKRKTVASLFHRIFHSRKIIVVSTHAVDYYPLGRMTQVAGIAAILGFVSWASYSTGSFMAAQSQLNEKDRAIAKVNTENRNISSQFSLLKNDLVKMKGDEKGGELSEYAQFVIKQYSDNSLPGLTDDATRKDVEPGRAMVSDRIQFLEGRVNQLKEENSEFVDTIRGITGGKINELEKAISQTGLKKDMLQQNLSDAGGEAGHLAHLAPAAGQAAPEQTADASPEGGPFIPYSSEDVANPVQKEAVRDVEHLMDLYAILKLLPLDKPMPSYTITSGFGVRTDPINGHMARHMGMDFSNPADPRVHATANGTVLSAGMQNAYGNMVELDHGLGITTRYAHLSKMLVKEGQKVKKGDVIGIEGSTGRSTGMHLHYEVRFNDQPLNPDNFLKAGMRVSQK